MSEPQSDPSEVDDAVEALVAEVTDEYLDRLERGQRPDVEEYGRRYPQIAEVLRQILPALKAVRQSGTSSWGEAEMGESLSPLGCLGDFRLLSEVGRGGMGIVYEAEQISLRRRVALKVLPFAAALDPKRLERFRHEAQAAALLHHTHIVPVFAVGCERGVYYYAMQFIEGQSLAQLIQQLRQGGEPAPSDATRSVPGRRDASHAIFGSSIFVAPEPSSSTVIPIDEAASSGRSGLAARSETRAELGSSTVHLGSAQEFIRKAVEWGIQAADALDHAHSLGIVHRDIKPANLLIDVHNHLWVTDFGLAQHCQDAGLTATGDLVGTLRYMSPEQALGDRGMVDHRTDMYALAATLYELVTLEPLLNGRTRQELLQQVIAEAPVSPRRLNKAVPVDLETILLKALAKEPSDRYACIRDLADDLRRFLGHEPIHARRPSPLERASKWSRRHRSVVFSGIVALVVTVVALAVSTGLVVREQMKTQEAYARVVSEQEQTRAAAAQAERNFQQARQMLDLFTQICEDELPDRPENGPVRNKLFEAALDYYEQFIRQSEGDSHLQAELTNSHVHVAEILHQGGSAQDAVASLEQARELQEDLVRKHPDISKYRRELVSIYHRIGILRGRDLIFLASQESVQSHLGLSPEQLEAVEKLVADQRSRFAAARDCTDLAALRRLFEEQTTAAQATLGSILSPEQRKRLQQISLQHRGVLAFSDPTVVSALALTEAQTAAIRQIQSDAWDAFRRSHRQQEIRARLAVCLQRILATLSDTQQAKWRELIGKKFDGPIHYGRGPRERSGESEPATSGSSGAVRHT